MSLSSDEKRSLDGIEATLRQSDPALAALHDEFNRRGHNKSMPRIDAVGAAPRYRRIVRPLVAALLVTLLVLAVLGAVQDTKKMQWPPGQCSPAAQTSTCYPGGALKHETGNNSNTGNVSSTGKTGNTSHTIRIGASQRV